MFYLTTHSTHFIYGYMASDIWLRTTQTAREETRCRDIGYSFRIAARVLLYASSNRQDNTYQGLCCTSRGALAGTRIILMDPPWRIDPTTHRTMSERSHHGATSRSSAGMKSCLAVHATMTPTTVSNFLPMLKLIAGRYTCVIFSIHSHLSEPSNYQGPHLSSPAQGDQLLPLIMTRRDYSRRCTEVITRSRVEAGSNGVSGVQSLKSSAGGLVGNGFASRYLL